MPVTPTRPMPEKALAEVFASFSADKSVRDATRILRQPVGSVNIRSRKVIQVALREDTADGGPMRHYMTVSAAVEAVAPAQDAPAAERRGSQNLPSILRLLGGLAARYASALEIYLQRYSAGDTRQAGRCVGYPGS